MKGNPYSHWSTGGRESQAWNEGHAAAVEQMRQVSSTVYLDGWRAEYEDDDLASPFTPTEKKP